MSPFPVPTSVNGSGSLIMVSLTICLVGKKVDYQICFEEENLNRNANPLPNNEINSTVNTFKTILAKRAFAQTLQ